MAFCSSCGAELGPDAAFCPKCGRPVMPAPIVPGTSVPGIGPASGTSIQQNVAGALCYVIGWITGLIFFLIDKRPFVRFHAMQSIVLFGGLNVIHWLLFWGGWSGGLFGWAFMGMVRGVLGLLGFVCWILLIIKAYQGQHYKLPVVGDIAENYSK